MVAAIQPRADAIAEDPGLPLRIVAACRDRGVMTRVLATGALQVSPALVIDAAGLEELQGGLSGALDDVA